MFSPHPPRKFEDLTVGESRTSSPLVISEEEIIAFARQFDPQWFHCDPQAAAQSIFGGLIASGTHTIALWRKLDSQMNGDIDYMCGVALDKLSFPRPVRAGDVLHLCSEIVGLRSSPAKPHRGTAIMRYEMINQAEKIVLCVTATNLIYTRKGRS